MHFDDPYKPPESREALGPNAAPIDRRPWFKLLNRYHWFVLVVAVLGWSFDTMDQQLFNLARRPAMLELLPPSTETPEATAPDARQVEWASGVSTSIFMVGWAIGGLIFGVLGDKIGRARTMVLTILLYSLFTGLSAFSVGFWDFCVYRFLTGLGVGGEFAVGVALVAEVMPERARTAALGWVQAFSAVGNITAALINVVLGALQRTGSVPFGLTPWRVMFLIGALPALLAVIIRIGLKEPDRWKVASREADVDPDHPIRDALASETPAKPEAPKLGSISELFGDPILRRNTIVGMLLAFAGVVGLWGIGFFSFDLFRLAFRPILERQGLEGDDLEGRLTSYVGYVSIFQNAGAFLGVYSFAKITQRIGRKPTFAMMFVMAMISTALTFWYVGRIGGLYTAYGMVFVMGYFQIALFGGYAIYFPELFPTRLRSTGTSFCYNVGRLVAAIGPLTGGYIAIAFDATRQYGEDWPKRYAGVIMCLIFLIGLAALPFAPETKDQPLPE